MRQILPVALIALALSCLPSAPVGAWGFNGHKFIADRAIDLLPQEIRPFFQKYRATVVEHAIDPDTYRTVGWAEEPPRHFLDMDSYGPFPFKDLPHDYKAAVAAKGADFVVKNGLLPWRTQEVYDQLREAFRQLPTSAYARDNVKLFSSVIAHYTADSFQPFHAAANYDGQLTGQQGIHSRFESDLFDRYQNRLKVAPPPLTPIPSAREFIFSTLTDSFALVAPILDADREAARGRDFYDDAYFAAMSEKAGPIMDKRIAGATSGVASMIAQAWIDAGRPALPVEAPARPPRPIRR
jgi:zinc dependent phospholipase C